MSQKLRIGYFAHWFQPPYKFVDFLSEEGITAEKIDFSLPNYLEKYDVVIIEQNGFNDYIENDEIYIRSWVERGGILFFITVKLFLFLLSIVLAILTSILAVILGLIVSVFVYPYAMYKNIKKPEETDY